MHQQVIKMIELCLVHSHTIKAWFRQQTCAKPNQIKYSTSLETDIDIGLNCTMPKYEYTIEIAIISKSYNNVYYTFNM
jgi:hypothetical protein